MKPTIIATFSIVAHDPETGEWGVAVQSKFLGVGSVVPWAKAGVGACRNSSLCEPCLWSGRVSAARTRLFCGRSHRKTDR